MTIDWINFTPWSSLAGGVMVGLAAALLLILSGRIAGISGIIGGLLTPSKGDVSWRLAFLLGLLAAPVIFSLFHFLPPVAIEASYPTVIVAGLLVGIGTRYGSGCTSGHGVCGLSRRSPRSLVAAASFMAAGFATVYIARHLVG